MYANAVPIARYSFGGLETREPNEYPLKALATICTVYDAYIGRFWANEARRLGRIEEHVEYGTDEWTYCIHRRQLAVLNIDATWSASRVQIASEQRLGLEPLPANMSTALYDQDAARVQTALLFTYVGRGSHTLVLPSRPARPTRCARRAQERDGRAHLGVSTSRWRLQGGLLSTLEARIELVGLSSLGRRCLARYKSNDLRNPPVPSARRWRPALLSARQSLIAKGERKGGERNWDRIEGTPPDFILAKLFSSPPFLRSYH